MDERGTPSSLGARAVSAAPLPSHSWLHPLSGGQSPRPGPEKRLPGSLTYQAAELCCVSVHEFIYYEQKCPEDWAQLCKSPHISPKGGSFHICFSRGGDRQALSPGFPPWRLQSQGTRCPRNLTSGHLEVHRTFAKTPSAPPSPGRITASPVSAPISQPLRPSRKLLPKIHRTGQDSEACLPKCPAGPRRQDAAGTPASRNGRESGWGSSPRPRIRGGREGALGGRPYQGCALGRTPWLPGHLPPPRSSGGVLTAPPEHGLTLC